MKLALEKSFSPKQIQLLKTARSLPDITAIWGTSGSGKSYTVNVLFYFLITSVIARDSICLISAVTSDTLRDNVLTPLKRIDAGYGLLDIPESSKVDRFMVVGKNIEIVCIGAYTEGAEGRVQGKNLALWYSDETARQPQSFTEMALGRCRDGSSGVMKVTPAIWTFNADTPSHWIKTKYLDNSVGNSAIRQWLFTFADNPTVGKDYIEAQKTRYTGVYYQRMIENKWVSAEGAIYNEFIRGEHVIPEIPKHRINRWILGVDWGYEHLLAILLIGEVDDRYFVAGEIAVKHQLVDHSLAEMIKDKWGDYDIEIAYGDTARPEYIETFQTITGIETVGADKEVAEGIACVQGKFKKRGDGEYGLQIWEGCTTTIRQLENYVYSNGRSGLKDEPLKKDDDCPDALRYAIYSDMRVKGVMNSRKSLGRIIIR